MAHEARPSAVERAGSWTHHLRGEHVVPQYRRPAFGVHKPPAGVAALPAGQQHFRALRARFFGNPINPLRGAIALMCEPHSAQLRLAEATINRQPERKRQCKNPDAKQPRKDTVSSGDAKEKNDAVSH